MIILGNGKQTHEIASGFIKMLGALLIAMLVHYVIAAACYIVAAPITLLGWLLVSLLENL